jgi:4-hydroxy-tetrahydrodipicolinate synthase
MLDIDNIKGVIPPIVTPVDVHENIDPGGLKRVIDHVINGGVHGVFVLGSNGEFYGFDFENQKRAIEITVEHVNSRIPVYAGANAITTKECIKLARLAEKEGADALTVLTPMYINPSETELYDHFVTIARSTKLPVLLYNNPGRTTNNISIGLLKKLACVENIVGIKNTNLDFSQTIHYLYHTRDIDRFRILAGTDYYIYSTLMHGGKGCVAGTANVAPKLVVEIYDRFVAGDYNGALGAQNRLIPLRNAYSYGSFPVVMKDCLNLMGLDVGNPVKPISHCSKERMEALKEILTELDLM